MPTTARSVHAAAHERSLSISFWVGVGIRCGFLFSTLALLVVTPHAIGPLVGLSIFWFAIRPNERLDVALFVAFLGIVNTGLVGRLSTGYYDIATKVAILAMLLWGIIRARTDLRVVLRALPGFSTLWLYIAWALVVTMFQPSSVEISLLKLLQYTWFMVGLLSLAGFPGRGGVAQANSLAWFLFVWLASLAVLTLTPFGQTGDMEVLMATGRESTLVRGIFDHSQTFGVVLGVSIPMMCSLFAVGFLSRTAFLLAALPSLLLLIRSSSRGGVLTMGLGFCALLVAGAYSRGYRLPSRRIRVLAAVAGVGVAGGLALTISVDSVANDVARFVSKGGAIDDDFLTERNLSGRDVILRRSFDKFLERPVTGSGFQVEDSPEFRERATLRAASVEKSFLVTMVLEETGIVGFLLFMVFIVRIVYESLVKGYIVVTTVFSAFLAANLSEGIFFSPGAVGGMVMIMLALAIRIDLLRTGALLSNSMVARSVDPTGDRAMV